MSIVTRRTMEERNVLPEGLADGDGGGGLDEDKDSIVEKPGGPVH